MKLAIIDPGGSAGGVNRLIRLFLPTLRALRPDWQIDYFASSACISKDKMGELCKPLKIEVKKLSSLTLSNLNLFSLSEAGKFIGYLQQKYNKKLSFLPPFLSGAVHIEIEKKTKGYDLVFFPWIYRFECPNLDCPIVGIMHDFNYKYHFCAKGFHWWTREYLNREIPRWLEKITPVVSTSFIKQEMEKFYPEPALRTEVIPLAPLSYPLDHSDTKVKQTLEALGIYKNYALFPSSTAGPHKNVGSLLAAFYLLKKKGHQLLLVLTGHETSHIRGSLCPEGVELHQRDDPDVIGLGYITDEQLDILTQKATLVVSPSLYEAGNGPGLDAWIRGVPVAMSNIPAFEEHLSLQGVKAKLFDPRSPSDMANKIETILLYPQEAKEDASISRQAISKYSWNKTVGEYIKIFERLACGKS